jgi:hypothetical protein
MEMKKTATTVITLSDKATASIYVCRWNNGAVQIELGDYDGSGVWQKFEIELTNELARSLAEELIEDLKAYDEKMAEERAAEEEAEVEES